MSRPDRPAARILPSVAGLSILVLGAWFYATYLEPASACQRGRWFRPCGEVLRTLSRGSLTGMTCLLKESPRRISYPSNGLTIVADLYEPESPGRRPAVILLHGAYPQARHLPMMRVLGERLREAGYLVLAPDARGYGESENPADLSTPASFDFGNDVHTALDLLLRRTDVDPERIYLLGHSFGGGVALAAYHLDQRFRKVVLLGPGRRITERILAPNAPDRDFFMDRARRFMGLPSLTFAVWSQVLPSLAIENYVEWLNAAPHVPLLLVDASEEDPADLRFLREIAERLTPPMDYWTVPHTDHYLHTGLFARQPCYNRATIDGFVSALDAWLRR